MMTRRKPRLSSKHSGLTLFELLLVLALTVILISLAGPYIATFRTAGRLKAAADQVRIGWTRTRNEAMRQGTPQAFVYQPQSRFYAIVPTTISGVDPMLLQSVGLQLQQAASADAMDQPVSLDPIAVSTSTAATSSGVSSTQSATTATVQLQNIADEVYFASGGTTSSVATTGASSTAAPAVTGSDGGLNMIVFYPDGSADDAVVWLNNLDGQMVSIELRGLTGIATVGATVPANNSAAMGATP
jgi:Tfp pilus assembly protein FimT